MRFWIDEESGCKLCEPDCADEWMKMIWEIGFDYDGYETPEGLKSLIDEIVEISIKARDCLREGRLFADNTI